MRELPGPPAFSLISADPLIAQRVFPVCASGAEGEEDACPMSDGGRPGARSGAGSLAGSVAEQLGVRGSARELSPASAIQAVDDSRERMLSRWPALRASLAEEAAALCKDVTRLVRDIKIKQGRLAAVVDEGDEAKNDDKDEAAGAVVDAFLWAEAAADDIARASDQLAEAASRMRNWGAFWMTTTGIASRGHPGAHLETPTNRIAVGDVMRVPSSASEWARVPPNAALIPVAQFRPRWVEDGEHAVAFSVHGTPFRCGDETGGIQLLFPEGADEEARGMALPAPFGWEEYHWEVGTTETVFVDALFPVLSGTEGESGHSAEFAWTQRGRARVGGVTLLRIKVRVDGDNLERLFRDAQEAARFSEHGELGGGEGGEQGMDDDGEEEEEEEEEQNAEFAAFVPAAAFIPVRLSPDLFCGVLKADAQEMARGAVFLQTGGVVDDAAELPCDFIQRTG